MIIREAAAEFLGTAVLIIFGTGVDCQAVLSMKTGVASFPRGVSVAIKENYDYLCALGQSWLSLSFGWAVGVAVGVWIAGGISGGHINPAVGYIFDIRVLEK
jgi:aquaglyceroporin related protein